MMHALTILERRWKAVCHDTGNLVTMVPSQRGNDLLIFGGSRNSVGAMPAETRQGLFAAYRAATRRA